ncbi:MAG: glycosyltransferase family 4 protein [Anaerolineae bacterium]
MFGKLIEQDQKNEYILFFDFPETNGFALPETARRHIVTATTPTAVAAAADGRRSLGDMWRMSRALSTAPCDLLIFPTVYSYVPVRTRAKKIVMIHDIIAESFPKMTLPTPAARLFWKTKVALGRWQADAIVTVSEYSRQGLVQMFGLDPARVFVVGEAPDPIFRRLDNPVWPESLAKKGVDADGRTLIYVGGFGAHKNLPTLIDAFGQLTQQPGFEDVRLILVGEYKKAVFLSHHDDLITQIAELGLGKRVIFPGFMPDEELVHLLNLGTALALPSLMEGYGLPAVEAAACGCPVIATTASPLPDLLGAGGRFVAPDDVAGWVEALAEVLGSAETQQTMRQAGLTAVHSLTWDKAAAQMQAVIDEVMGVSEATA